MTSPSPLNRLCAFSVAIALGAATMFIRPASAHHSFAMFDMEKSVSIEGTVKEFAWTNPHVILWVVANHKEGEPEQVWPIETTSPGNLSRSGWDKHTFHVGDRVRVDLHPMRSGVPGGAFTRATFLD